MCWIARHKPVLTVEEVISDILNSISTKKEEGPSASVTAFFTDQKGRSSGHRSAGQGQKLYFTFGKPVCWSTNHKYQERAMSLRNNKGFRVLLTTIEEPNDALTSDEGACDVLISLLEDTIAIIDSNQADGTGGTSDEAEGTDAINPPWHNQRGLSSVSYFEHDYARHLARNTGARKVRRNQIFGDSDLHRSF